MNNTVLKSLAFGLVTALAVAPAQAVILDLNVTPQPAQIGDIVHATLSIDSQGALFDGFSLSVEYDPSVVRYRDDLIDFSVFTGTGGYTFQGTTPEPTPPTGTITAVSAVNFLINFDGTFDLVKFAFEAVGVGTSTITLNDGPSGFISFDGQNVQSGPVTADISVVPLPATALLLPAALAGLAAFRRRSA